MFYFSALCYSAFYGQRFQCKNKEIWLTGKYNDRKMKITINKGQIMDKTDVPVAKSVYHDITGYTVGNAETGDLNTDSSQGDSCNGACSQE